MTAPDALPPVGRAYLEDLSHVLRDSEERDEVVRDVREHLVEVVADVAPGERDQALRRAIEELGSAQQIATTATPRQIESNTSRGASVGMWLLAIAGVCCIPLAVLVAPVGVPLAIVVLVASVIRLS